MRQVPKRRNVLREFLVLGEDSSLSHTLKYLASPASATLPGGIPIPEPSQEEKRLGAAANDVLRQPSPATPEFPPKSLQLGPAWTADMCRCLDDVLEVHGIAHTFADLLGVWPFTVSELATAFREGQRSRLLAEIFTSLLQLIQADMEVAQSTLAVGGAVQGQSLGDKAALQAASRMLNEAWAWGLDNEAWRAHLNPLTWPEVLRQFAVTLGWGARRKRSVKQIAAGHVAEASVPSSVVQQWLRRGSL